VGMGCKGSVEKVRLWREEQEKPNENPVVHVQLLEWILLNPLRGRFCLTRFAVGFAAIGLWTQNSKLWTVSL